MGPFAVPFVVPLVDQLVHVDFDILIQNHVEDWFLWELMVAVAWSAQELMVDGG